MQDTLRKRFIYINRKSYIFSSVPLLKEEAREQYYGSSIITEAHVKSIIHQEMMFQQPGEEYQQNIHDYRAGKKPELKRRYRN